MIWQATAYAYNHVHQLRYLCGPCATRQVLLQHLSCLRKWCSSISLSTTSQAYVYCSGTYNWGKKDSPGGQCGCIVVVEETVQNKQPISVSILCLLHCCLHSHKQSHCIVCRKHTSTHTHSPSCSGCNNLHSTVGAHTGQTHDKLGAESPERTQLHTHQGQFPLLPILSTTTTTAAATPTTSRRATTTAA